MSTTTESSEKKMLTLKTNDDEDFQIKESIATQSVTIKNLVKDECKSSVISLPSVSSKTLTKVIEYLKAHADSSSDDDHKDLEDFDKKFMDFEGFNDRDMLFDLVMAAYDLDIRGLSEISCRKVANAVEDMSAEIARDYLGIKNDFSMEEEQEIRSKYA